MRVTASGLPLLSRCAWWARDDVPLPARRESEEAALGTVAHQAIAELLRGHVPAVSDEAEPYVRAWRDDPVSAEHWTPETPLAWDPEADTGRILPPGPAREYGAALAGELCGTCDARRFEGGRIIVADWKCASGPDLHADPPGDNLQLGLYALALCRAHGLHKAELLLVRIDPGGVDVLTATLDVIALDALAGRLADLVESIPGARPTPGPHCTERWCPALAVCPVASVSAEALARAVAPVPLTLTVATAPALLARVALAKGWLDAAETALKALADETGGIPMPGGRVYRRCDEVRETVALHDGPGQAEALAVLAEHGFADAARQRMSCAWADVRASLVERMPGRVNAKARREAEERLREALASRGLLTRTMIPKYRETEAK